MVSFNSKKIKLLRPMWNAFIFKEIFLKLAEVHEYERNYKVILFAVYSPISFIKIN